MAAVNTALTGIAGVHYVVSELSLRGLIALPTTRNTAGVDVVVLEPDATAWAAIQVKSSSRVKTGEGGRQWWPMGRPDKSLKGPNVFYIFLRYRKEEKEFEAFLESANEVVTQVEENLREDQAIGRRYMPFWGLPATEEDQNKLAQNWQNWRPLRPR